MLRLKGTSHKYKKKTARLYNIQGNSFMLTENTIRLSFIKKCPILKSTWYLKIFKNNVNEMCLFSCSVIHSLSYLF